MAYRGKYFRITGRDRDCNVIACAYRHLEMWKVRDMATGKEYGSFGTIKRAESCMTDRLGCSSLEHHV